MPHRLVQRSISVLCLMAFVLGQTVFASVGVRCTDASGETRIEYACVKSGQGSCGTTNAELGELGGADHHEDEPVAPCEDVPLGVQACAAKLVPQGPSLQGVFAAVVVVVAWNDGALTDEHPPRSDGHDLDRERPPDSLARLRTVILMV